MLEGYITPLFMGYVDKYIKNLKPEDLSLSLWGGDVVLQNLELNLDVLQKELNLPVTFLSGKIHKLQLHVPWTRLIYEPVVVTIKTMEFIIKLNDSGAQAEPEKTNVETENQTQNKMDQTTTPSEDLPPGYVQSLLNKVVNNICFKVENVIIKYVEDDIVFSLNAKSVDYFCVDSDWKAAFIDLVQPELLLRRMCTITDLTICLDQRTTSGKIDLYQDPVLYKCSLTSRIVMRHRSVNSTKPIEQKFDVSCESLDFSLADLQIPMVLRLIKLVIGLFYGTLDLPGCNFKKHSAPIAIEKQKNASNKSLVALTESKEISANDSWSSWAWSMLPVASEGPSEQSFEENITSFGLFIKQVTLTLKRTSFLPNMLSGQRIEFSPVMGFELNGCNLNFTSIGDSIVNVNLGLKMLTGFLFGKNCLCAMDGMKVAEISEDSNLEHELFLKIGVESSQDYLKGSLFENKEINANENPPTSEEAEKENSLTTEESNQPPEDQQQQEGEETNESLSKTKFSADARYLVQQSRSPQENECIFFNYFYEMKLPIPTNEDNENIFLFPNTVEKIEEISEKKVVLNSCQSVISTSLIHSLEWLSGILDTKLPQRKEKQTIFLDPFVLEQLQSGNFLSRKTSIELQNISIYVLTKDHEKKQKSKKHLDERESICFELSKCSFVNTEPMYTLELRTLLEKGKILKLMQSSSFDTNIYVEVTGLQSGISVINLDSFDASTIPMLQPFNFQLQCTLSLLQENREVQLATMRSHIAINTDEIELLFTKLQILLYQNVAFSWLNRNANSPVDVLTNNIFNTKPTDSSLMRVKLFHLSTNLVDLTSLYCMDVCLGEINVDLFADHQTRGDTTSIFHMPTDTQKLSDIREWHFPNGSNTEQSPDQYAVQIKMQYHKEKGPEAQFLFMNLCGFAFNFDYLLHKWLSFAPTNIPPTSKTSFVVRRKTTSSLSSTTPRRAKSYARVRTGSTTSPSHHSKDSKDFQKEIQPTSSNKESSFEKMLVEKINTWKCFQIKVSIESGVLVFPEKAWNKGCSLNNGVISLVRSSINAENPIQNSVLILCTPGITLSSSQLDQRLYEEPFPCTSNTATADTLPWTITLDNFSMFTFLPNQKKGNYICKPLSCKIFLAASSNEKQTGRNTAVFMNSDKQLTSSLAHEGKMFNIGFVIHADCTSCEIFLSKPQISLVSTTTLNIYESFLRFQPVSIHQNDQGDMRLREDKSSIHEMDTTLSVSSASTNDFPDNFSMMTDSSVFSKKSVTKEISFSLWIQFTIPKVKLSMSSNFEMSGWCYHLTSDLDELTFAFDYQDTTLELTNKISSLLVYYSAESTDETNPPSSKKGIIFCQKEKSEASHSKSFLSLTYRRSKHHLTPTPTSNHSKLEDTDLKWTFFGPIEGSISKQELEIFIQSFDLVLIANPIISTMHIFVSSLKTFLDRYQNIRTPILKEPSGRPHFASNYINVWPIINIKCGDIRLIAPSQHITSLSKDELVLLLHFQAIGISSQPINPIRKTVVNRNYYKHLKEMYRDSLKKKKLWNVQYQLDITNVGLCTTNWKSVQLTMSDDIVPTTSQNPAVEWNTQASTHAPRMTAIFVGFDLNATFAPSILTFHGNKTEFVTSSAVEFHSPRPIEFHINTLQVNLIMQLLAQGGFIVKDISSLFTETSPTKPLQLQSPTHKTSPQRTIRKESSLMESLPPVELFGSISNISLDVYSKDDLGNTSPILWVNLIQPNCSLNTVENLNCSLTIQNVNVLISKKPADEVSKDQPFPSQEDYDQSFVSCTELPTHSHLPAPFLKTSLVLSSSGDLDFNVSVGRLLLVNLEISTFETVNKLLKMIPELNSGVSQIVSVEEQKTTKKSPVTSLKLRKVQFETKGLHVVYSSTENVSLMTGWHELNMEGTLGYNGDGGEMKEISSEVHWIGLFLSTKLNNDEMNLLSPLQMKINSQLQFSRDRPPIISISLVCGLIEFNIYQEFVEIFEQLNTGMKTLLPTMYPQSKADSSPAAEKPVVVSNVGGDDKKGDCVENVTVDDLRNGSFEYILVEDGIERTPCEMQVTFSSELDLVAPVMTWCYNEPRVITQLVSLPVPFHIPRDLTDQSDTAILEVDCCVQYFNEIQEEFVTCGTFCLSENNSSSVILCDEKMLPNTIHYQSILWRIVIATAANSSRFNFAADLQNGRAPLKISPIPATSLAACLKINSCACPSLQPHFRCKADVKNLKVILRNPMESESKETKFPHDVPSSIESLELNLTSLNTSLMICPSKALLHSNASFHVATMDFHDLCWIDLISPTVFSLQLRKELKQISNDPHPVEDEVVLKINEMDVLLSQSSLHTLLMTNQMWSNLSKKSPKSTILNHYVIRNRTEDVLLFQQCEQEEELRLESGHTYPYSLFDHSSHSLQFRLEQVENCAWSNDVRLNVEGVTTCVFEHEGYTSKLIVETKLIGGLQYEVVVHGSCSFINNTSCPLHLKVITQKTENTLAQSQVADVTHSYNLSSDDGQISLTASCDYIKEFCLYAGSRDDPIRADDNTDKVQFHKDLSKMFKVKIGGDMFWVSFDQKKELANQTIVTFHPLFVARNHLSQDITIHIGEEATTVNLPAKGQETQISAACIDEEQTLKVTLNDHRHFTWTDITLSSSTHLKLNESKTLCNPHLNACNWPYAKTETTKSSLNDSPGKTITLTDQNEQQVDIIIEFSLKWEHLQTVVMDIKPCMLFCNETSRTLHIKATGGPSWSLERSSVRHVFEMKEFSLMVQESTTRKDVWSPVIALTDQTVKSNNDVLQKQCMKIGTTSYVTLLDKENNLCYQIVVQSKRCDGMIIMVLKERFALRNLSNENVKVVPVMFQKPDAFKVLPSCTSLDVNNSSTLPFSMLNISTESTLKHDKELPEGLAMNFILGQCDQGNQETSLINHHLTKENTFVLSEDHLREYIHLKNSKNDISTCVLSSYLDEGVINVCIADDSHPVVQITNKCSVILALREEENVNEKTTHHPVLESNMEKLKLLKPNIQTSFVPNNFKAIFPKLTNPIEFHCQFALYVANSVELSKPIKLSNHSSVTDIYVPAFGHITLTSFVHNSQLFVEIDNEGKDNAHPKTIHCLPFPNFNLNITSLDVILIDRINSQDMNAILSLSTSDLQIEHIKTNAKDKSSIQLSVGNLQLDNQISEDIRFHFPVILLPMRKISQRYHKVTSDAPFADIQASPDADFFTLKILLSKKNGCTSLDDVELCIQPFEMFLEDAYIYRLAELMKNYLPNIPGEQHATVDPISSIRPVLFPLKTCKVHIAEISFLLSIHASVKVFLAADHIPLKLGAFDCQPTQTIRDEFVRVLLYHYATQVLVRVGWILGSLELIGNPTGLIHSIGRGISDFVTMPYHGLTRGPTAFVSGISHGLSSFVKHVSTGTLTSITNVSSSISRNLDRLCLDETHLQMQEERRAQVPTQTLSGLNNAMGSLGMSLLSAVAGLVDHSIQNISSANTTQEAVTGAFSGLAKGVLGVFTKPLGGAMEFVSQTSQGILQGAGFVNIPERVNIFKFNDEVDSIGKRKSTSKILWKYLHCKETPFTFIAPCTNNTKTASKYSSFNDWLIITSSAVFLLDQEKGVVKMAFPLSDIEPHRQENETKDHVKLLFSLQRNHIEPSSTQNENLNHVLNMRQFFDSFDAACLTTKVEEMSSSSASKTGLSEHVLCVLMSPLDAELFLLNFHMAQK